MALGAYVTSKDGLKEFILQRLGEPVITINVTDIQIQHCINDALEHWVTHAEGGTQMRFMELDITGGNLDYQLGFDVEAVTWVYDVNDVDINAIFPAGSYTTTSFTGTANYVTGVVGASGKHDLLSIELTRNHLQTIEFMLSEKVEFDFNSSTKVLHLFEDTGISRTFGLTYYQRVDYSNESSFLYDHTWIKRYSTAMVKLQWANNMLKYTGTSLPAGVQLNAESILNEAKEEIDKLDEELWQTWRLPTDFFIG